MNFQNIFCSDERKLMNRLNDKVAIITGGNSGVGAATAKLFAEEGAQVVISARRKDRLDEVAREIEENGGEVLAVECDIAKPEDVKHLVEETLKVFGQIDVLVNNAGILEEGLVPIDRISDEEIERIIDTNLIGTMLVTREVTKEMAQAKEGTIVNVSSVAGVKGNGSAAYAASKGGIIALTRHTALRFANQGIRANAVCPGTINTPMNAGMEIENLDKDMFSAMRSHYDLRAETSTAEDIASIILFLASDESRAVTGQALVSDFGASL